MKNLVVMIALQIMFLFSGISKAQLVNTNNYDGGDIITLAVRGTNIVAEVGGGDIYGGIYLSTNNGINWKRVFDRNPGVNSLVFNGTDIFAAALNGVYLSTNNGADWIKLSNNQVNSITVIGNNIFPGIWGDGVYLSTNYGTSWTKAGLANNYVISLASSGNNIFAGTLDGGLFLSTDNGTNWTQVNNGLPITSVNSLAVNGTNIFAATNTGVFLSTNNGTNWTQSSLKDWTNAITLKDTNIFVGTMSGAAYTSTDNGKNWTQINNGLPSATINSLAGSGTNIFAGTNKGVFISEDNGVNWTQIGIPNVITPVELTLFTANANNLITKLTWKTATETNNRGFEIQRKTTIYDFITVAFVNGKGTSTKTNDYSWSDKLQPGIYSYRLKQVDYNGKFEYSKEVEVTVYPNVFSLEQNYPNPFNPATVISYALPSASNVKLIVYNSLGQTVKVLDNGFKNAGNYTVNFNAAELPSGIYFYKLEAGEFIQVKKMMVIK